MSSENLLKSYLKSENHVGLDAMLKWQLKTDGAIASALGITSLAPIGFFIGFIVSSFFWI